MKLIDYLKREKIRPVEFARQIGMSEGTISLLCHGKIWPKKGTAQKIVEATGGEVTPTDFLPASTENQPAA